MRLARLVWYPTFAIAMGIFIPEFFNNVLGGIAGFRYSATPLAWISRGLPMLAGLVSLLLALLLFWRRSNDPMALFTSFFLLFYGIIFSRAIEALSPFFPDISRLNEITLPGCVALLTLVLFAIFPDGRFVPRWTRWVVLVDLLTIPFALFWASLFSRPPVDFSRPVVWITTVLLVVLMIAEWSSIIYAQVYRYRHVSTPQQRQQTKWAVYGMSASFGLEMILTIPWIYMYTLPSGSLSPPWQAVSTTFYAIWIAILPVTLTIAVMRYRLYDIDRIINRTLVYGTLTACIAGLYALIVGGAGLVIPTNPNLVGLLIVTALVWVLYRPTHAFLQRGADRIFPAALSVQEQRNQDQTHTSARAPDLKRNEVQGWRRMLRPLWIAAATLSVAILFASLPGYLVRTPTGNLGEHLVFEPTPLMLALHQFNSLGSILTALLSISLAALLFMNKFDERMGQYLSFYLLAHGILLAGPVEMLEPFWPEATRVNSFLLLPFFLGPCIVALISLFPDGHFVPSWSRWLVPAPVVLMLMDWLRNKGASFSNPAPPAWLINLLFTILSLGILLALAYIPMYRYRVVSTPEQRQQTRWVVYGFCLLFVLFVVSGIPWRIALNLPAGSLIPWWLPVGESFWFLGTAILPITLAIAVMRYRLYDIDFLINRTLVYGALSGTVIAIYILVVGVIGTFMHTQGNLLITLLATGLIAVLFHPLRERLQRAVNRLIYGERDDPIEALSRLGKQMETALPPDQVLPALAKTIAETLKLPFVAITLRGGQRDISFGEETENPVAFPFIFQGETTGVLLASPRNPGDQFTPGEMRLLQNLARQAGAAVRNAQLTADLQRSRQTLVTAREEERHRLRRDLHDGIGPTMAGLTLKLDAAKDLVSSGLESGKKEELEDAVQLLSELKSQTQETVQNIRHIVHTLRPPSLDVLGLVPALQAHFGQVGTPRNMKIQMTTTPQSFPRLSAAVEVAAYHIVLEAVTNVIHHAQAEICEVSLALGNGNLKLEIKDDGVGLPKTRNHGIGLDSMRERAEELGGRFELSSSQTGTQVCAEIPTAPAGKES
jgi:signal transduction histidine kinase